MYEDITQGPASAFSTAAAAATAPTSAAADLDALEQGTLAGHTNHGRTMGAIEFSDAPAVSTISRAQANREEAVYINGYTTRLRVTLGSITADNVAAAFRGAVSTDAEGNTQVASGSRGFAAVQQIAFVAPWGSEGHRTLFVAPRCSLVSETVIAWSGDTPSQVAMEFAVLEATGDDYTITDCAPEA